MQLGLTVRYGEVGDVIANAGGAAAGVWGCALALRAIGRERAT
jgi:hypothetical protein